MNSARFPIKVYYEGGPVRYAKGGLHDEASAVRSAGRNGDGHLVHVNDEEFAQMKAEWGEPTINPETGMPEFFLGKVFKVFKKIAPIAVSFIPGVGPIAGAALGAGLGAVDGGWKGALAGGLSGAMGGAGGLGTKLGGSILSKGASEATKAALGSAITGALTGAITGQDPLKSALLSGGTAYLGSQLFAPKTTTTPGQTPPIAGDTSLAAKVGQAADVGATSTPYTGPSGADLQSSWNSNTSRIMSGAPTVQTAAPLTVDASKVYGGGYTPPSGSLQTAAETATAQATRPNWWNRNVGFLGKAGTDLGIKNKHAVLVGGLLAGSLLGGKSKDEAMPSQEAFFGDKFGGNIGAPGNFKLASVNSGVAPESPAAEYAKRYFSTYATGGDVEGGRPSGTRSFAVQGEGTGREDKIPALLSDGEYVIDAETVALLGDGSSKAGAKALDDFRVKVRKHKGQKLAKGKFSVNAKKPEAYMRGGRL